MAKFKSEHMLIRHLAEVTIVFWKPNAVLVYDNQHPSASPTLFHNYFAPKNYYTEHWEPFYRALYRRQRLTLQDCRRLATYYGVLAASKGGRVDLAQRTVELRLGCWAIVGKVKTNA